MNENLLSPLDIEDFTAKAQININDILNLVFNHTHEEHAVVVYDTACVLSKILTQAYKHCLPHATFIDFDMQDPVQTRKQLDDLESSNFVALVQSSGFRLDSFRIRVELFKRDVKVIEHPHLERILDADVAYYIDALAYDSDYYRGVGRALKEKIDAASSATIDSGGEILVYSSPFELAKLNIGDYSDMPNMGGQFPIGEVFTESQDLKALNGRVKIFVFGDTSYKINRPQTPITLIIREGQLIDCENSTPAFDEMLLMIREVEGVVWVRELGFGLNRAFTKTHTVSDTGSYERMCGVHISLGAKHGMYAKPGFKRRDGKFHIDVFVDTDTVTLADEVVFKDGAWIV